MNHKEKVNVNRMIIYSFIPFLWIYAAMRIKKFWLIFFINISIGAASSIIIPFPYSYIPTIPATIIIVRYFAKKYNEKLGVIS